VTAVDPAGTEDDRGGMLRVRLLQTDPVLGDVDGNLAHLDGLLSRGEPAHLAVTPELATHGYHLGLLDDSRPLTTADARVTRLGRHGSTVVLGMVEQCGRRVHNSAAVVTEGSVAVQRKLYLPTYRQWGERKHFTPGDTIEQHEVSGARVAVLICNDIWQAVVPWLAAHAGAEILVVPTNSAVSHLGRPINEIWETILQHAALTLQCFVVFVNRVGEEAGNRFWGGSRVIGPTGETLGRLEDDVAELTVELDLDGLRILRRQWPLLAETRPEVVAAAVQRMLPGSR
jgi:predicted amidohydrolase